MTNIENASTQVIMCKCQRCGLHFTAYSWNPDWLPQHCPECGESSFLIWKDTSALHIFELVPGNNVLTAAGNRETLRAREDDGA